MSGRGGRMVAARAAGLTALALLAAWFMPRTGGQTGTAGGEGPPVSYELRFPEPQHRWMEVEVTLTALPPEPLSMRMSASSPGRYARHDFAKNVFRVQAFDGAGDALKPVRSAPARWDVTGHDGAVRFVYRVYGDRVDGTYLAVDDTHAHVNMPAGLMWGHGLEDRPVTVRFEPPPDRGWRVATQLYPTDDPFVYAAPNLDYLLDSPVELSRFAERSFTVADPADPAYRPEFRVAVHHAGADREIDRYAQDVERIVREMVTVFGEFPRFETGRYTFIADYLPTASGDAMEHRNSTVLTAPTTLRASRRRLLGSVSHEFFHVWNVERIRPRSLEPFDFEDVNPSGELWLAEGVTNYYGALILQRAGLAALPETLARFASTVETVERGPGRRFRSASDMSRLAPFTDAASAIDRTNWGNLFISYYTWGEALGLGLDLLLRARADDGGRAVTLDDYMRLLWRRFGRDGATVPGRVDRPYTAADARAALADVTGDEAFADEFFGRYVDGREVIDFAPLFERAGLRLRPRNPGRGWLGGPALRFERGGARVVAPMPFGTPLHAAGLARDDLLVAVDGRRLSSPAALDRLLRDLGPGRRVTVDYERRGAPRTAALVPEPDPARELVPVEQAGGRLTPARSRFRAAWLGAGESAP